MDCKTRSELKECSQRAKLKASGLTPIQSLMEKVTEATGMTPLQLAENIEAFANTFQNLAQTIDAVSKTIDTPIQFLLEQVAETSGMTPLQLNENIEAFVNTCQNLTKMIEALCKTIERSEKE